MKCGTGRRLTGYGIALGIILSTSGCVGSLLKTGLPVVTTYVLAAAPVTTATESALTVDLAISQATATPGLDSERIAVLHEARRLDYYVDAQWGAVLPQVTQAMVVGSLQNQKWFRSVSAEQVRVSTNYWLELEVRDFQAEYARDDAAPTVRVTFVGTLIRIKDRKLMAVLPATVTVTAAENKLSAVITAFESASQQASLSLGQQTVSAINSNKAE
jgi:cholesterol transport system auxiliary component